MPKSVPPIDFDALVRGVPTDQVLQAVDPDATAEYKAGVLEALIRRSLRKADRKAKRAEAATAAA